MELKERDNNEGEGDEEQEGIHSMELKEWQVGGGERWVAGFRIHSMELKAFVIMTSTRLGTRAAESIQWN